MTQNLLEPTSHLVTRVSAETGKRGDSHSKGVLHGVVGGILAAKAHRRFRLGYHLQIRPEQFQELAQHPVLPVRAAISAITAAPTLAEDWNELITGAQVAENRDDGSVTVN